MYFSYLMGKYVEVFNLLLKNVDIVYDGLELLLLD